MFEGVTLKTKVTKGEDGFTSRSYVLGYYIEDGRVKKAYLADKEDESHVYLTKVDLGESIELDCIKVKKEDYFTNFEDAKLEIDRRARAEGN